MFFGDAIRSRGVSWRRARQRLRNNQFGTRSGLTNLDETWLKRKFEVLSTLHNKIGWATQKLPHIRQPVNPWLPGSSFSGFWSDISSMKAINSIYTMELPAQKLPHFTAARVERFLGCWKCGSFWGVNPIPSHRSSSTL